MPGEDDRSRDYYGERPPPTVDPTKITTEAISRAEKYLKELFHVQLEGIKDLYTEKFKGMVTQITERDAIRDQAKIDANERIEKALQAAKEAVGKTEANFTDQIRSLNTTINEGLRRELTVLSDTLRREISDLKDRQNQDQGQRKGTSDSSTMIFVLVGIAISAIAAMAAVAAAISTFFHHQ